MRDPDRIPVVLEEFSKLWKEHPDLRFGQLFGIVFDDTKDPFFIEDEIALEKIKKTIKDFKNGQFNDLPEKPKPLEARTI